MLPKPSQHLVLQCCTLRHANINQGVPRGHPPSSQLKICGKKLGGVRILEVLNFFGWVEQAGRQAGSCRPPLKRHTTCGLHQS